MKKIIVFVLIAFSFLMSCNNTSEKIDLSIGVMSSTDLLPYAIAQKKGFFEKYELKVDIQKFYSANDRDAAFQSKNIDGTITDLTGAVIQHANGIDLQISSKEYGVFHILTNDSTINSITDLKDKELASSKNTVIDFVVDMALQSVGLNSNDIKRQEVNKIPIRLEMLQNYKTSATGLPEPFISIALNKGMHSIVNIKDLGYNVTCMIFHKTNLDEKSEKIKAMYAAYNEAVEYICSHDRADYKDILIEDLGVPEHLIEIVLLPDYQKYSLPSDKDIETVINWLKKQELIPQEYMGEGLKREL